jgi:hypothetical protein
MTLLLVALTLAVIALIEPDDKGVGGRSFARHRADLAVLSTSLQVVKSRMNWAHTRDGTRIFVVGVLTNTSPVHWRGVEFDCRFFNTNGVMVDASTDYSRVTVCPQEAAAFRVSVAPTASTNDYASFAVSVSHARSGAGLF